MGSFRRVDAEQAGDTALGILVPPGRQTFVILRPRSLLWDLLMCRQVNDWSFAILSHAEASAAAQNVYRALRDWTERGHGAIESVAEMDGHRIRVLVGSFAFVVCARNPGQPYTPLACAEDEVGETMNLLREVLSPAGEQELYFNTRFFDR